MAQRRQRGWLKKEIRTQGETWVLYFRTTRKFDGRRLENKIPIGFVLDFPDKSSAWAEVERLHLALNPVDSRRGVTFADLAQHHAEHELVDVRRTWTCGQGGCRRPKLQRVLCRSIRCSPNSCFLGNRKPHIPSQATGFLLRFG